jgi:hypothetical protein
MAEESSRLLANSTSFRDCAVAKNSCLYTLNNIYCAGVPNTISNGDEKGREPQVEGGEIGTTTDVKMRNCLMARNTDGYTCSNQYCAGVGDTISDGDERGRDPLNAGGSIGTVIDINMRNCLMSKNGNGYTYSNQYCAGVPDTVADGDERGREPQNNGEAGTATDMKLRTTLLAKNSNLYTKNHQYGFGNGTV